MVAKTLVPTFYAVDPCNTDPVIRYSTRLPTTLYLIWDTLKPIHRIKYRTVAGWTEPCGFETIFHDPHCIPQIEIQPSTSHTFVLPSGSPGDRIYYVFSDSCDRALTTSTTPLLSYVYPPCPTDQDFVSVFGNSQTRNVASLTAIWNGVRQGNPNLFVPSTILKTLNAGAHNLYTIFVINTSNRPSDTPTSTWLVKIEALFPTEIVASESMTIAKNSAETAFVQGGAYVNAGKQFRVRVDRTAGTGLIEKVNAEHQGIFTLLPA